MLERLQCMCFVVVPRPKSQLQLMRIDDILGHPLKPLQVCLPSIVGEFVRLVKANHIFSLPETLVDHDLLESEQSRVFGGVERLDMFFPFDPCLLSKCDRYIRPNYVYWSMVRSTYDEDEDVAEAYDRGDGSDRYGEGQGDSDADELEYSLDKMSITPRDSSHKFGGGMQSFMKIRPSTSPESL